ncbi:helix-turn-helix domain-containing protein [Caldicellulosiruptor hydrothermalis]
MERGIKQPTISTIGNLCKAFNISLSEFFKEDIVEISPEVREL